MPELIEAPSRVEAAGTKPKLIDEYVGRVNTGEDRVSVLMMESRIPGTRLEQMLAVGVDGCRSVRGKIETEIRKTGAKVLGGGFIASASLSGNPGHPIETAAPNRTNSDSSEEMAFEHQ